METEQKLKQLKKRKIAQEQLKSSKKQRCKISSSIILLVIYTYISKNVLFILGLEVKSEDEPIETIFPSESAESNNIKF